MERLAEHGIAERETAGSAHLYELNRQHLSAPAIEQLVSLRALLVDRLRAEIASWDIQPVAAALFGSAARGDGGIDSDIDLFIVRPAPVTGDDTAWRDQLDALAEHVRSWTGNSAGIAEVGAGDLGDLLDRAPPVLDSLRSDAIDVGGRPVRSFLRKAR